MQHCRNRFWILLLLTFFSVASASAVEVRPLIEKIRDVGPQAAGHAEAMHAFQQLARADADQIPALLAGMDGANPLAVNWIRLLVESIAQRAEGKLPMEQLNAFLAQTDHSPRARRLAYELILSQDPSAQSRWIPRLMDDPSIELRRDAVAHHLERASELLKNDKQQDAKLTFRQAFNSARDVDQIKAVAAKLEELGEEVDLPTHFGWVMRWMLIGPFDNTDKQGFEVSYPPETQIDLKATHPGKGVDVAWREHTTKDEYGLVDLNQAVGKHMGSVAYAYAVFESDEDRAAQIRLGSANGNKVWVNGELVVSNHVYHTGMEIDQYTGDCRLNKGPNEILVKIAQNEQTEDWAQKWHFQLRVCDRIGTAILSRNRTLTKVALLDAVRR